MNDLVSFAKVLESKYITKEAYIRKLPNGKYRVYAENGKHLGTYESRSAAEKRLRQVEYFKHKKVKSIINRINNFVKIAGLKDLIEKYPQHKAAIEFLHNADPSPNKKYLNYAVKNLVSGQALQNEISDVIKLFHKHQHRLDNKDINSYNFTQLRDKLLELSQVNTKSQIKNEIKSTGGKKLYEDEQCILMLVKNKGAACFYGAGTKWCITMDSQSYYEQYVSGNVVFIFLLRKDLQQENPSYKVAMAFQRGLNNEILKVQYFNAIDNIISEDEVKNGLSHFTTIKSIAENTAKQEPKGFLAILKTKPETLTLEDYKKNMNEGQSKEIIAKDVNTPPEILAMLAKDGNEAC